MTARESAQNGINQIKKQESTRARDKDSPTQNSRMNEKGRTGEEVLEQKKARKLSRHRVPPNRYGNQTTF